MIINIPLEQIDDNPWQTRRAYDDAYITELAADIYRNGLIQIPAGRILMKNGRYPDGLVLNSEQVAKFEVDAHLLNDDAVRIQLAVGHNRLRAYRLLRDQIRRRAEALSAEALALDASLERVTPEQLHRWDAMPVHVAAYDDQAMAKMAWAENEQRRDLTPLEEALAIQHAMTDFGWNQTEAGEHFGLNRATVANKLRLLKLPADVREHLHTGKISERQAGRLLPLYQLPEPALKAAAEEDPNRGWTPTSQDAVERALNGSSSDDIELRVQRVMERVLRPLDGKTFPLAEQVADGNPAVHQGRCPGCEMIVKRDGADFCGDKTCFEIKTESWRSHLIGLAQARNRGLKALNENKVSLWQVEHFSYGNEENGRAIAVAGCPRDNLRLYYDPDRSAGVRAGGVPEVRIVCAKDGKPCYCLQAKEREARADQPPDPAEIAEKEAKKRLEREIVQPAVNALIDALAGMEPEAWRVVLKKTTYGLQSDILDGEWEKVIRHVARRTISGAVPWHGHEHLDKARVDIDDLLHPASITPQYPDAAPEDPMPDIRRRFARVNGWIDSLTKNQPTTAALRGNIENLERIQAELDALPNEQVEELFYGAVGIALTLLRELLPICIEDAVELSRGFEHVGWLTGTPPGDINWKTHLDKASAGVLRYTLAIVCSYGDGGHKVRRERLEARLRQVGGVADTQAQLGLETAVAWLRNYTDEHNRTWRDITEEWAVDEFKKTYSGLKDHDKLIEQAIAELWEEYEAAETAVSEEVDT